MQSNLCCPLQHWGDSLLLDAMSCGELLSDSPFNWADTEDCTRLNRFNTTFLGWLGCSIGRYFSNISKSAGCASYSVGTGIPVYTSKQFNVSWYLNWKSLTKITAPSGTRVPTLSTKQSPVGSNKVIVVSRYYPGDDVILSSH